MSNQKHFCPGCGQELPPKAKQCPSCGQKRKKPVFKKWWFWAIIVVVIIAIGASGGKDEPAKKDNSTVSTPAEQPNPAPQKPADEPAATPEPEPEPEPAQEAEPSNIFRPGDVIEASSLTITYQECETDWQGYSEYLTPAAGNKVVRAYFVFENTGSRDVTCGSFEFQCYADGVSCDSFIWSTDDSLSFTTLSPGRKLQGNVYYEVPNDAGEIELEYETSFWTQEKVIFIVE